MERWSEQASNLVLKITERAPELLLTLLIGYIAIKIIRSVLHGVIRVTRGNQAMKGIILSLIDIVLWTLLIAVLLRSLGLTQISLVLSSGVAFFALALSTGSAALLQDLIAGLFLAQDPDIRIGEYLEFGETKGLVEKLDARKIRLRDEAGNYYIVPNAVFDKAIWKMPKKEEDK